MPGSEILSQQISPAPLLETNEEAISVIDEPLPSSTPDVVEELATVTPEIVSDELASPTKISPGFFYRAQSGDTLQAVARRFGLHPQELTTTLPAIPEKLLKPGEILTLPHGQTWNSPKPWLLPDSEVVYGPSAQDFSVDDFLYWSKGALSQYQEWLESTGWNSAAQIIERVALENSINPRLLVSLLEWECGCVTGRTIDVFDNGYILGVEDYRRKGLYGQLSWAARTLAEGYYGWRVGSAMTTSDLDTGSPGDMSAYLPPDSNAGTAALVVFFSRLVEARSAGKLAISLDEWQEALDPQEGLVGIHARLFGDPWARDSQFGDLLPFDLQQPVLLLPFEPGWIWSFTSGPHPAWENSGALSALDFAPAAARSGCEPSPTYVLAVADGLVVRSENGIVVQDLDSGDGTRADGYEGSGWAILYMHVHSEGRVPAGIYLKAGDPIGHPSCEGGPATGTHLHIARKYNGEWIAADGPVPFVLEGWTAHNGSQSYEGSLTKGDQTVTANVFGPRTSWMQRTVDETPLP